MKSPLFRNLFRKILTVCLTGMLIAAFSFVAPAASVYAADATVTVDEEEVPTIKLNVYSKNMVSEDTFNLQVYNMTAKQKVTFKSSDTDIATVDSDGIITAVKTGEAVITATIKKGLKTITTLQCAVKVGPPAISIKITKDEITLVIGKTRQVKTILKPNITTEVPFFYIKDSSIATVSPAGKITAKEIGETILRAYISNGNYYTCVIHVVEKLEEDTSEMTTETEPAEAESSDSSITEIKATDSKESAAE